MANYSFCFSPTGGTKKVAGILADAIGGEFQQIDLCCETEKMVLSSDDLAIVSVPSFGGRVPAIALERMGNIKGNGAKAILVAVYGNREWDDTLTELQDTLERFGFVCIAAVAAVAEHSIFRQFASGRPDAADAVQLAGFAAKIQEKLDSAALFGTLTLTGNHGTYVQFGGVPFKPEGNRRCDHCGLCAKECPVRAIPHDDPRKTDKDKCISCMRCVGLCPRHARDFNALLMKGAAAAMASKLGGHKENHLFLS